MAKMTVTLDCYGTIDKEVTAANKSSGRIFLPAEWIGKKVRVMLLEEIE